MQIYIKFLIFFCIFCSLSYASPLSNSTNKVVKRNYNGKILVHIMPWHETRETSEDGQWGIHWTMATRNPDIIEGDGRRQIAAHYYPLDDVYGSGDPAVVERQLLQMKYAGVDGVLIDWPGMIQAWDYPKNHRNCEAIIRGTEQFGLDFAICYEDHNVKLAYEAGFIGNMIEAAKNDMRHIRDHFFPKSNYIRVNGSPFLIDFGPQTFKQPWEWQELFTEFPQKPTFLTLWYQWEEAAGSAQGEFNWIWTDFYDGVRNFYQNRPLPVKMGVAYPGFHTYYEQGGWPGPGWSLPHNGVETFKNLLNMAVEHNLEYIQIATWNDIGEGTMIEPTREFGHGYLNAIQELVGVDYGQREFDLIRELYKRRVEFKNNPKRQSELDHVSDALNNLNPDLAEKLLLEF